MRQWNDYLLRQLSDPIGHNGATTNPFTIEVR